MKTISKLSQTILLLIFLYAAGFASPPVIENRRWVLEKFRDPQTRKVLYPEGYHYLEFNNGQVSFSIDCNSCSKTYEFISKDSINIEGPLNCTYKNCIEKDAINLSYSGKYKIWVEGGFLIIRTRAWDHIYK